jgi:radical SAM superfamily enzyme YgiQ (UPF0313 family)
MEKPVCLVIPPSGFLLDERVFMSLGILRVAAMLENKGVPVEVLDLSGVENFEEVAALHAKSSEAEVFGLTATTPQLPAAAKVLKVLRREAPKARMILGGPHITLVNAAAKRERRLGTEGRATAAYKHLESLFDTLVAGDGEDAVFDAIRPDAPALVDADDPQSALFLTNQRLDALPFPARHLVDVDSYKYGIEGIRALSMIAQLGCPFECGFCGGRESPMLRRVRMRTTENIVRELEELHRDYGVRAFMLYDDELNVNPKMVELMREIKALQDRLGVEFRLRGFVKSQLFNKEQAEAMYAAGFRWLLTGFESGSPRILENINKKATLEENTRCFEIARAAGLKVKALMSIGHPGENEETIRETKDWLLQVKPDDFDLTIITTYPGTPYYDRSEPAEGRPGWWVYTFPKNGDRLFSKEVDYTEVAEYYKGDPNGGYQAFVETDELTAEQLVSIRDATEAEVREKLNIPYNPANPAKRFEASMGQFGLPPSILRKSAAEAANK